MTSRKNKDFPIEWWTYLHFIAIILFVDILDTIEWTIEAFAVYCRLSFSVAKKKESKIHSTHLSIFPCASREFSELTLTQIVQWWFLTCCMHNFRIARLHYMYQPPFKYFYLKRFTLSKYDYVDTRNVC